MSKTVNTKLKVRRDTSLNWSVNNPILASGQIGYDVTVNKIKVGNGSTTWNSLSYLIAENEVPAVILSSTQPQNASTGDLWLIMEEVPSIYQNAEEVTF